VQVVSGGAQRQDSVRHGIDALPPDATLVVVHDGVRPLVTQGVLERVVEAAKEHGAATAAVPIHDTVKRADGSGRITETLDRQGLWSIQTPQAFRVGLLREAHEAAKRQGSLFTDDAGMVEAIGQAVYVVE